MIIYKYTMETRLWFAYFIGIDSDSTQRRNICLSLEVLKMK